MNIAESIPDNYNVALKAFLRDGNKILICKDFTGTWDLPGGRIGVGEFYSDLNDVLAREIREELGDLQYTNNGIVCLFRHKRPENAVKGNPERRIFMIGFDLEFKSGLIQLSDEHTEYKWLAPAEALDYFGTDNGQRSGIEKYIDFIKSKRVIY